jgi:anti-sigma factor RsiW
VEYALRGMTEQQEFRHELEATLAAREEIGEAIEPQLVDRFADRIEQEIERRANEQAWRQRPRSRGHDAPMIPLALGSLGLAIPLMGIAGGTAGFPGVLVVCLAIVLVNFFWAVGRR